jgi:hypothetical protein
MLFKPGSANRWSNKMRLKSPGTENTSVHPISTSLRARCLPKHAVDLMIGYTVGAGLAAFDLATAVVVDLRTIVADEPVAAAGFGFPVESKDEAAAAASGFGFCIDPGVDEAAAASSAAGFGFILDDEAAAGCGFSIEPEAEAAGGLDADDEADVGRGFSIEPDDEADVGRDFSVEPDDEAAAACGFAVAAAACEFGIEAGSEVMIPLVVVLLLAGELGLLASRRRTETSLLNLGERVVLRSAALTSRLPLCDVGLCAVFAYKQSSRLMRIVFFFSHTPTPAMPHTSAKFSSQQTTQQQRHKLRFLFSPTTLQQPTLQSAAVFSTATFVILSRLSQRLLKSFGADQVAALHSCV